MIPVYGHWLIVFAVLVPAAALSIRKKKLTVAAGAGAVLVGLSVYAGCGYTGLGMLAAFFVLAVLATAHRKGYKARLTVAHRHQERRQLSQVLANGGIPAVLGLLSFTFPPAEPVLNLMLAGAIASATADTLASELGMVYGRNTFNVLSWRREPAGLDGVISIEGTLSGVGGATIIALIYAASAGLQKQVIVVIVAGAVGNLADSVIGALWERKHYLGNDAVNTLNTLVAALFSLAVYELWIL
jgi:uncharacterized protein (TIGR00297 family)